MPIPFRDADEVEALGAAGFLKFDASPDDSAVTGALFFINARGEPVEFAYNSVETPNSFLWRQSDIRSHSIHALTTSLFAACSRTPLFIACLADEVHDYFFASGVQLSIPVCCMEPAEDGSINLLWIPDSPAPESLARRLLDRLRDANLLLEPFDRALYALKQVYSSSPGNDA